MRTFTVLTSSAFVFMFWWTFVPNAERDCAKANWQFAHIGYSQEEKLEAVQKCRDDFCEHVKQHPRPSRR